MVKNVFDGHVEVLKLGHLLLVSAAQNFFCEPKIAYRFRLGSSCLSLEVFKTVQSKALFREIQMVNPAWRVEMNLFTKNIRGFVDFGKQAESKNPCVVIDIYKILIMK